MKSISQLFDRFFASRRFNLIAFYLIAGLILLAYSNTFTADFHFDDNPAIVENQALKRATWENFISMFSGTRPVVNLSLFFNYQLSGLNPVGWHIFNISLHIANTFFVYLLILATLNLPTLSGRYGDRARRMALFGALLFGLHPVQTESVTYIISRTELLASFFYLATFLLFLKGARTGKLVYYIVCMFTSLLAMKSKEWAVTLPATLLLYDLLFISDCKWEPLKSRWGVYLLVALPWLSIAYTLATVPLAGAGFGITGERNITPATYLLTSFNVLWTYIKLLILPINQNLDYGYPVAKTLFGFPTLLALLGHILMVCAACWMFFKKRWTLVPFGIAWFYITLSPTQSFVPILDVIFEHRLYLPSIGFFIAFIVAFEGIFDWVRDKTAQRKNITSAA
jgi:protein O-mannosyl-transferase